MIANSRLAAVQNAANSQGIQFLEMYSYTAAGTAGASLPSKKRLQVIQGSNTMNLDGAYTYNSEGSVASTTYPNAGPTYTYSFDSMYRPSGLTGTGSSTVVNNVSYGPSNELLWIAYNGLIELRSYNSLLQLTSIATGYSYPLGGVVSMEYSYPAGPNNIGKACLASDLVTGEQVAYSYDTLNRLTSAAAYSLSGSPSTNCTPTSTTATWSQAYSFDGYGNLSNKAGTGGAPSETGIGSNSANNQITMLGSQYDANGNLTAMSEVGYSYDAENRMLGFSSLNNGSLTFAYDSQNKRVWNWTGSTDQHGNPSGYTVYYYGVKGERLGMYNITEGSVTSTSTEIFFGARRLAPLDRLGSARNFNFGSASYYPFGEDKSTNPSGDAWRFGTYWRDSASGLDYAGNRFYSSALGRFMTPDPYMASGGPSDPRSWNRYTYDRGDPINRFDPTGQFDCDPEDPDCDPGCDPDDPMCGGSSGGSPAPPPPLKTFAQQPCWANENNTYATLSDLATNVENIFAASDPEETSAQASALDLTLETAVGLEWDAMNNELGGGAVPDPSVWNNLSVSNNPLTKNQFNGGHFVLSNVSLAAIAADLDSTGYKDFLDDFGGGIHGKYQQAVSGEAAQHGDWLHSHIYTTGSRAGTATFHFDDYPWWNPLHAVVDVAGGHIPGTCLDAAWH